MTLLLFCKLYWISVNRFASLAQDSKALVVRLPLESGDGLCTNASPYFNAHLDNGKLVDELIAHLRAMSKTIEESV